MKVSMLAKKLNVDEHELQLFVRNRMYEQGYNGKIRYGFKGMEIDDSIVQDIEGDYKVFRANKIANKIREEEQKKVQQLEEDKKRVAMANMLITSGFNFDGYTITKYSGYISGDDVISVSRGKDGIFTNATDTGSALSDSLVKIRRRALQELKEAAYNLGCNAVIGVDFDYITLEPETANYTGGTTYLPYIFCVTANGNAVVIEKNTPTVSISAVLKDYKELLNAGIITQAEFDAKKAELL